MSRELKHQGEVHIPGNDNTTREGKKEQLIRGLEGQRDYDKEPRAK